MELTYDELEVVERQVVVCIAEFEGFKQIQRLLEICHFWILVDGDATEPRQLFSPHAVSPDVVRTHHGAKEIVFWAESGEMWVILGFERYLS